LTSNQAGRRGAELDGQVAVVTGAGRGIGRAIALALGAAGACVAALARSGCELATTVEMIERAGGVAKAFVADVTKVAVQSTMAEIEQSLGPISVLINNAGRQGPMLPFCETDVDDWWRVQEVNLRGPMLCSRAVLPGMISRRQGRIINIASSAAPIAYFSSYTTSKTALIRFTETVAIEARPYGVSMFAVGPGTVRSAMSEYALISPEGQKWLPWFQQIFDEGLDVPMERPVQLVLQLASGLADRLTGRFLSVSDDLDMLLRNIEQIEANNLFSLRVRILNASNANSKLASIRAEAEQPRHLTLRIECCFTAPCKKVFEVFLDGEAVKKWFLHDAAVRWREEPAIDARPGGHYSWSVISDDGRRVFHFHGVYQKVDFAEEIVFTWEWHTLPIDGVKGPGSTQVTLKFFTHKHITKVVLVQTGLPDEPAFHAHDKGWRRCFDGIAKLLSSEP
jgi:NAD(P)-dependent dehydrogenase (short-subunit alcohol dehydrogenase family)/uncharacterized protein YndB with AHSA1/START domain